MNLPEDIAHVLKVGRRMVLKCHGWICYIELGVMRSQEKAVAFCSPGDVIPARNSTVFRDFLLER